MQHRVFTLVTHGPPLISTRPCSPPLPPLTCERVLGLVDVRGVGDAVRERGLIARPVDGGPVVLVHLLLGHGLNRAPVGEGPDLQGREWEREWGSKGRQRGQGGDTAF